MNNNQTFSGLLINFLLIIAVISVIVALAGLFFPVQKNYVRGEESNGEKFEAEWLIFAFITAGGYLYLCAGLVNLYLTIRLKQKLLKIQEMIYWAIFNSVLLISAFFAGRSPFYFWQNWIPGDIMHAFGTEYVFFQQTKITNPLQVGMIILTIVYILMLMYTVYTNKSKNLEKDSI